MNGICLKMQSENENGSKINNVELKSLTNCFNQPDIRFTINKTLFTSRSTSLTTNFFQILVKVNQNHLPTFKITCSTDIDQNVHFRCTLKCKFTACTFIGVTALWNIRITGWSHWDRIQCIITAICGRWTGIIRIPSIFLAILRFGWCVIDQGVVRSQSRNGIYILDWLGRRIEDGTSCDKGIGIRIYELTLELINLAKTLFSITSIKSIMEFIVISVIESWEFAIYTLYASVFWQMSHNSLFEFVMLFR